MKESTLLDETTEKNVQYYMPKDETIFKLKEFFFAFSDITRIKILSCLAITEMCVGDISNILNINQTTISHQLKLLKNLNIVKYKRNGKIIIYSLQNKNINDIMLNGVNYLYN